MPEPLLLVKNQRIAFANEPALRLLGSDEHWLVGKSPQEFFHPASIDKARARSTSQDWPAGLPTPPMVEENILRADGAMRCVQTTVAVGAEAGECVQLIFMHDVTDLRWAQAELLRAQAELRHLAAAREAAQEAERQRIGWLLHDELLQPLAAMRMEAGAFDMKAGAERADPVLARVSELALTAIEATRRIIDDLRPPMLDELGLSAALEALLMRFSRRTRLRCKLLGPSVGVAASHGERAAALCLYRVAQESLANIEQHAQAAQVDMRLVKRGRNLALRIRDDGVGLPDTDRVRPGTSGLLGMRERLSHLGGSLKITSSPRRGTTIEATIPASDPPSAAVQTPATPCPLDPSACSSRTAPGGWG